MYRATRRELDRRAGRQLGVYDASAKQAHLSSRDSASWNQESHEWRSGYDSGWDWKISGPGRFVAEA